jgi:hypothetical protein
MADWNKPLLTSTYVDFLAEIKARDSDLALQFDGASPSNTPTGAIRWSSSANRWQKWSGSAWGELTATYALTALTTTGNVSVGGNLTVTGSVSFTSTAATATTQAVDNNSLSVATTAFVVGQAGAATPNANGTAAVGTSLRYSRQDHVHPADTTRAPLASPTFTGTPVVPSLNGGQLAGLRNRIINGEVAVDRRKGGGAYSIPSGTVAYTVDRWWVYSGGSTLTAQRTALSSNGFAHALRFTGSAGNTVALFGQRIESVNCLDMAGKTVTLSYYAASSGSRQINYELSYAGTTDSWSGPKNLFAYGGQPTTTSYVLYSHTFAVPSAATTGLQVEFFVWGGLASGTVDIFGVQLEVGSQATPFERRPRGLELALCQRYFYTPQGSYTIQGYGNVGSNTNTQIYFPVEMRATPTITAAWSSLVACSAGLITAYASTSGALAYLTCTAAGDFAGIISWTSFDAEL